MDAPAAVKSPGFDVTVYPVMDAPPLDAVAVKLTVASPMPAVAVPMVGVPGNVAGAVKLSFEP